MRSEIDIFREYLQKNGLKHTPQRDEILSFLLKTEEHMSPEDIFQTLRRKDPKLGRATVFRTLKLLEECGLASSVTFADGTHKYERKHGRPHHDHLICVQCGRTFEFSSASIERIQEDVAVENQFKILWHRHEIFGRCVRCENGRGMRNR